jgi:hypothetical protein
VGLLDPSDTHGACEDLGVEVVLDTGEVFLAPLHRDATDADLHDGRIHSERSWIVVTDEDIARLGLAKDVGLVTDDTRFTVRRIEGLSGGFNRVYLSEASS